MTEMAPFVFPDTGQPVRLIDIDGAPWMVAKDVCDVLALSDVSTAVSSLDDDEKMQVSANTISDGVARGGRDPWVVNEPGLYRLIFKSRKPEAKAFQRWVFHVVLPEWRKAGAPAVREYSEVEILEMALATAKTKEALKAATVRIDDLTLQITEQAPKVEVFDDLVAAPEGCETIRVVAKEIGILQENELRELLIKRKVIFWTPCQVCKAYRGQEVRQYQYYARYGGTEGGKLFALRSTSSLFGDRSYAHAHQTLYVRTLGKIRIRNWLIRRQELQAEFLKLTTPGSTEE